MNYLCFNFPIYLNVVRHSSILASFDFIESEFKIMTKQEKQSFNKLLKTISKTHREIWKKDWKKLPEPEDPFPNCGSIVKPSLQEIVKQAESLRGLQNHIVFTDVNKEVNERQDKIYDVWQKAVNMTKCFFRVKPSPGGLERAEALERYREKRHKRMAALEQGKPIYNRVRYPLRREVANSRVRRKGKFTGARYGNPWFP